MKSIYICIALAFAIVTCVGNRKTGERELAEKIRTNPYFKSVKEQAVDIMKTGFNAGSGYREVWIRDYNTFIELAARVHDKEILRENLMVFFRMQGKDGNIIDGFTPIEKIGKDEIDYFYSETEPRYAGHKNTVETDQETSLVQAVYKYVKVTGDNTILDELIEGKTMGDRMELSMDFLMDKRFSDQYGLLWGATTADWGDVQPEHGWGVDMDENTHPSIDIYDNAMFLIALDNLLEMKPASKTRWGSVRDSVARNCRRHLWDTKQQKFIPHIYLKGSPFPPEFDENQVYYFGGTAIAIEAGLLSSSEITDALHQMVERVRKAGAASIGLTLYPPYPEGFFANKIMNPVYSYQNGGDWTWFGGRMIQQLIKNGLVTDAYEQIQPMVKRVIDNHGFYEWYSVDNKPRGSGTFRGEAGVLYKAIVMLEDWSRNK